MSYIQTVNILLTALKCRILQSHWPSWLLTGLLTTENHLWFMEPSPRTRSHPEIWTWLDTKLGPDTSPDGGWWRPASCINLQPQCFHSLASRTNICCTLLVCCWSCYFTCGDLTGIHGCRSLCSHHVSLFIDECVSNYSFLTTIDGIQHAPREPGVVHFTMFCHIKHI